MNRVGTSLLIALTVSIGIAGCQSAPMPVPSPTPTASGTGPDGAVSEDDLVVPAGSTTVGDFGDPCLLLKKSEIEKALGVAVLGVARGELKEDGSQLCAWAMDAEGSSAAALGGFVGTVPGDFGAVVDGLGTGGAAFGVFVGPVDSADLGSDDSGDTGDSQPAPGVNIVKVNVGSSGAVVTTPNGGAAFTSDGIRTLLTLMDLITGPPSADALELLLTTAYNRL